MERELEHAQTREATSEAVTVTEIEIHDTTAAPDPETGEYPVKARIRQRAESKGTSHEAASCQARENANATETQVYEGGELAEAVVIEQRPPSLWERVKKGVMWGVAAIMLAAAGWMIYKQKK